MKFLIVLTVLFALDVMADDPPYCRIDNYKNAKSRHPRADNPIKMLKHVKKDGLHRLKVFEIGQVKLAGLAVGDSSKKDRGARVRALSRELSQGGGSAAWESKKGCVYYTTEDIKEEVAGVFNEIGIHRPNEAPVTEPLRLTEPHLPQMLSCLQEQRFLALGCNGERHRGPTEFGLMLSIAGCRPEQSLEIVKKFWGSAISDEVRLGVYRTGYEFGSGRGAETRRELQTLFSPAASTAPAVDPDAYWVHEGD